LDRLGDSGLCYGRNRDPGVVDFGLGLLEGPRLYQLSFQKGYRLRDCARAPVFLSYTTTG
jgi:hypothetical protein